MGQQRGAPVIEVEGGKIRGAYNEDRSICVYKGIPFAGAPTGNWRWKAPRPVEPWEGVLDCTDWGDCSVQSEPVPFMFWSKEFLISTESNISEDCLNLCVWSPNTDGLKPVLVFIHGGGFSIGGCSVEIYNGEELAKRGIVCVDIQYRLGTLGFLAHSALSRETENGQSGNYGIMDQIAALQWIQRNIEKFGGDPDRVTISGQSAGGASVDALISSPKAAGLFRAAVSMSLPSIIFDFPTFEQAQAAGDAVLPEKSAEELRAMPADEVMTHRVLSMCVDGTLVPASYEKSIVDNIANPVPLIVGLTLGDGPLFSLMQSDSKDRASYEAFVREKFGDLTEQCLKLYPAATDKDAAAAAAELQQDYLVAIMDYLAKLREMNGMGKTWCYLFTRSMPGETDYGAFHTADVPYFFHVLTDSRSKYWEDGDRQLADTMIGYLVNFVSSCDPNGNGLPDWEESRNGSGTMRLDCDASMFELSHEKRRLFAEYMKRAKVSPSVNMKAAD